VLADETPVDSRSVTELTDEMLTWADHLEARKRVPRPEEH
jgi:hypothetical protein